MRDGLDWYKTNFDVSVNDDSDEVRDYKSYVDPGVDDVDDETR